MAERPIPCSAEREDQCEFTGSPCAECGDDIRFDTDYYVLNNRVWNLAMTGRRRGRNDDTCGGADGQLHIACVEARIGRALRQADFIDCLVNEGCFGFDLNRFQP